MESRSSRNVRDSSNSKEEFDPLHFSFPVRHICNWLIEESEREKKGTENEPRVQLPSWATGQTGVHVDTHLHFIVFFHVVWYRRMLGWNWNTLVLLSPFPSPCIH